MATSQPPLTPDQRLALEQRDRYIKYGRNVAIGGVILIPVIALMPPRKLDLYTFSLGVGFFLSADHLSNHYTGRGLLENSYPRSWGKAERNVQMEIERRKEREGVLGEGREALKEGREKKQRGFLANLWMGDEEEGWQERRLARERKKLEEGGSYTGLILDQIWEVWNWDKKEGEDGDGTGKKEEKKP